VVCWVCWRAYSHFNVLNCKNFYRVREALALSAVFPEGDSDEVAVSPNYLHKTTRPHAVSRVTGARPNNYQYDANGNMVQDNQRQLIYNSFNKPTRISKAGYQVDFSYDAFGNRYKRIDTQGRYVQGLANLVILGTGSSAETRYIGNVKLVRMAGGSVWLQRRYVGDKAIVSKLACQVSLGAAFHIY
jgi:YD repeat-containing protein